MSNEALLAEASVALVEHLRTQIGFTIMNKEDSPIMKAVALGMDLARNFSQTVPTGDSFMRDYATTLGTVICLPASIRNDPRSLIQVVVHEAQHVLQFGDTGVEFAWFYLADPAARSQFEADAYAAGIAVDGWLTGEPVEQLIPTIIDIMISGYHIRAEDAVYAEAALKSLMTSISAGVVTTRSARMAIAFLEDKYPTLKGAVA